MTRAATFRREDVQRAIKATEACGLSVAGVEVTRDGTIRVLTASPASTQLSAYDNWKAQSGARKS